MKKKFKLADVENAIDQGAEKPLELIMSGQWVDEGKYQHQENILKDAATGKFHRYSLSKSGSHFTDFTYSFEWDPKEIELVEVVLATKTVEYWKEVA